MTLSTEKQLSELLEKEYGYYQAIHDITTQENDKFVNSRPMGEIANLMKKKKILVACIEEIEGSLQPLKKLWQKKEDRSDPLSQKTQQQFQALDSILKGILDLDKANQKMLEGYLLALRGQRQACRR